MKIKYQKYGIKDEDGNYYQVFYRFDKVTLEITVDAKEYGRLPCPDNIQVINESDLMTDYFEADRFKLTPNHPDYKKAMDAMLSFWEKKGWYIFAFEQGDYEKRKASYMRNVGRLGTTEETAEKLAEGDVNQYNALCEAIEIAKTISKGITSTEYALMRDNRVAEDNERERRINLSSQKNWALEQIASGAAKKIGNWSIQSKMHFYTIMFDRENIVQYSILAINIETGERHPLSGEYDSVTECKEVIDIIVLAA